MYISRKKRMMEERIKKLDGKMQEYIEQGRAIGIFNDANLERVVTRLERVDFQIDNTLEGDAYTTPNRDEGTITIKINENRINNEINNNGKKYFEDEVIFHELTHAVNGLYEQSTEKGDAFKFKKDYLKELEKDDYSENYDLIKNYMSDEEKEKFDSYVKNEDLRLAGYGWILLDEFASQTIAQKMVKNKYNDKNIYPINAYNSTLSNPEYRYYSDLADYPIFTPFATSFIETLYGTKDISNFCMEALDEKFVEKIFQEFQKRPNGLEDLYKMLGYMGNIYYADGIQKGHYNEKDIEHRKAGFVKNKEKIYDSIKKFIKISEKEEKTVKGENEEAQVSTNSNTSKANKKEESESQEDKLEQETMNDENKNNANNEVRDNIKSESTQNTSERDNAESNEEEKSAEKNSENDSATNPKEKKSLFKKLSDWFKNKFNKKRKSLPEGEEEATSKKAEEDRKKAEEKKKEQDRENIDEKKKEQDEEKPKKEEPQLENQYKNIENELIELSRKMAEDYKNHDYKSEEANRAEYEKILSKLCDLKMKNSGKKLSKAQIMLEKRQIDFICTNLVFDMRDIILNNIDDEKLKNEKLKQSLKEIRKYCEEDRKPLSDREKFLKSLNTMKIDPSSLNKSAKEEKFPSNKYSEERDDR